MKISLRWLSRHVDLSGIDPRQILADLTMSTAEIEVVWASSVWSRASYMLPAIHAVKVMRDQKKHERCRVLTFPLQQRRGNCS